MDGSFDNEIMHASNEAMARELVKFQHERNQALKERDEARFELAEAVDELGFMTESRNNCAKEYDRLGDMIDGVVVRTAYCAEIDEDAENSLPTRMNMLLAQYREAMDAAEQLEAMVSHDHGCHDGCSPISIICRVTGERCPGPGQCDCTRPERIAAARSD